MHKKFNFVFVMLFFLLAISFVSAVKPITSIDTGVNGYQLDPTQKEYIQTGQDHEFEVHVYNSSNGYPITSGVTCYMHLYYNRGNHELEMMDDTVSHNFDYAFDVGGGNFTGRGEYEAKFTCNNSVTGLGGGSQITFFVNDYGEELNEARVGNFKTSMLMFMILFLLALVGMFLVDHYIGKFALYWIAHVLFVIGTFSMWQFNQGYEVAYFGLVGVWKILFYVSTIAVFPMLILSLAWIFYIHTFNEHFQKLVDKGESPETAFNIANKKSGGWRNGQ